jgi:hypothetical protein
VDLLRRGAEHRRTSLSSLERRPATSVVHSGDPTSASAARDRRVFGSATSCLPIGSPVTRAGWAGKSAAAKFNVGLTAHYGAARCEGQTTRAGQGEIGGVAGRAVEKCGCETRGRPNGLEVHLRGQGPRGYGSAAHGVHACESRDAGRAPPSSF